MGLNWHLTHFSLYAFGAKADITNNATNTSTGWLEPLPNFLYNVYACWHMGVQLILLFYLILFKLCFLFTLSLSRVYLFVMYHWLWKAAWARGRADEVCIYAWAPLFYPGFAFVTTRWRRKVSGRLWAASLGLRTGCRWKSWLWN